MPNITPCLWFDRTAEQAVHFYSTVFDDVTILEQQRMPDSVLLTAIVTIAGQKVMLLNGGPTYQLTEAFSFLVSVETQDEVDRYWNALTADGEESQCGWLNDKFGLSWQIIPMALPRLLSDPEVAGRVMQATFSMRKIVIADLEAAAAAG